MGNQNFIFGIALTDSFETKDYTDFLKKEYNLKTEQIKRLKPAYLFRLSDNIRFCQFDADIVLWDEEAKTYYHTGDFEPTNNVEKEDIVAMVDENLECEII